MTICIIFTQKKSVWAFYKTPKGFPGGASGKGSACQGRRLWRLRFDPWVGKIPWRRKWQPTPVFLPGEPHGQRSLEGYSPWVHKESDTTECLSTQHTKHKRKNHKNSKH